MAPKPFLSALVVLSYSFLLTVRQPGPLCLSTCRNSHLACQGTASQLHFCNFMLFKCYSERLVQFGLFAAFAAFCGRFGPKAQKCPKVRKTLNFGRSGMIFLFQYSGCKPGATPAKQAIMVSVLQAPRHLAIVWGPAVCPPLYLVCMCLRTANRQKFR